jgi:hypothetical protein
MKTFTAAFLALSILALPAHARAADDPRFLRLETALTGYTIYRQAEKVGPTFIMLGMTDAMKGSPEAQGHVRAAQAWSVASLVLALGAGGLYVGAYVSRDDATARTNFLLGAAAATIVGAICGVVSWNQLTIGINRYNYDLQRGALDAP